jgi:phytoene dehydrogenase-like protein
VAQSTWDAIVVGGGVNGLVCAAYLAKAGRKTLVLEARDDVGGGASTGEIAPGFRAPRLAHATSLLRRDVVEHLRLLDRAPGAQDGSFLQGDADVAALDPNGGALVVYHDPARTAVALGARGARTAEAWRRFSASRSAIARVLASLFPITPPSVDEPGARDLWHLLKTLRQFRALGREDAYTLLRWGPMPVADLVGEAFDDELLRATVAADGIFGTMLGPWSAGSGMAMLLAAANEAAGAPGTRLVRGGPGRLAEAVAAHVTHAGGEVRTGSSVARFIVRDDRARGVVLATGDEIAAKLVVSALDPKRTFLELCDPSDLAAEFLWRIRHYRMRGTLAKVNLALSGLPAFTGVEGEALTGRVRIGPTIDYLERAFDHAKYGRMSSDPWIELTIPSLLDADLAPAGAHVLSACMQFAPYHLRPPEGPPSPGRTSVPRGDPRPHEGPPSPLGTSVPDRPWDAHRDALAETVLRTLEHYAPGIRSLVLARDVITPEDLEHEWGLTGGHIFHGELAVDQLLTMRPLLGWGQYRSPIDGLYLCGSGTHPGTGLTGGSGANAAREILRRDFRD